MYGADVDVWWYVGDSAVFARWSYIQEEIAVQVADGRQRFEEELHPSGRSVDGRLRQVLLRTDRQRSGKKFTNYNIVFYFTCTRQPAGYFIPLLLKIVLFYRRQFVVIACLCIFKLHMKSLPILFSNIYMTLYVEPSVLRKKLNLLAKHFHTKS